MISLEQWRAVIGCFSPSRRPKVTNQGITINRRAVSITLRLVLALSLTMLLSGDIETNPGPGPFHTNTETGSQNKANQHTHEDTLLAAIDRIDQKINNLATEVQDIKRTVTDIQSNTTRLQHDVARLTKENKDLRKQVNSLEHRLDDYEGRSRRNNLIFTGLDKSQTGTNEQCEKAVTEILKTNMGMDNVSFERVHKLKTKGKTDQVIAQLSFHKDCRKILQNKRLLKGTNIYVNEDFTTKVRGIRQKLQPIIQRLRNENKTVKLVFDHLYIDGQRFDYDPDMNNVYEHRRYKSPFNHDEQK